MSNRAIHGVSPRTRDWLSTLVLLLSIGCNGAGSKGGSMSNGGLSMTKDDLEQAYQVRDPLFGGHQSARGVAVGPEGVTVLAHADLSGGAEHTWVLRLNFDGEVVWERHYDPKYGIGNAIVRHAQGEFVIAGEVKRSAMAFQASLLHITATGSIIRAASFGPPGVTGFNSVQYRENGALLAGGSAAGKGWFLTIDAELRNPGEHIIAVDDIDSIRLLSSGDIAALSTAEWSTTGFGRAKLSSIAPDGQVLWQRELPTSGRGNPSALVVRQDGALAVGNGAENANAPTHVWLAHCDNAGLVTWEHSVANARGWAAVAVSDGYAVAGDLTSSDSESIQHIWRLDDDGRVLADQLWSRRNLGSGLDKIREFVRDLATTSDGGLILVGSTTRGAGKTNVWVVRLDPDGKLLWERIFGQAATSPP